MDVFIRNVPPLVGDKELRTFFQPVLESLKITTFACQKSGAKWANLTFLHLFEAQKFLATYGQGGPEYGVLRIANSPMYFSQSTKVPDKFQLRSLSMELKKERQKKDTVDHHGSEVGSERTDHSFNIVFAACRDWSYQNSELLFSEETRWQTPGELKFGRRSLIAILRDGYRIDIAYENVDAVTIGGQSQQELTVTCLGAPKFSEIDINALLKQRLLLKSQNSKKEPRVRLPCLGKEHEKVASACFVYRFGISPTTTKKLRNLKLPSGLSNIIYKHTRMDKPHQNFTEQFQQMMTALTSSLTKHNFQVLFQMQKLAQNGLMPPLTVVELLPEIKDMSLRSGVDVAAEAVYRLTKSMPARGPETGGEEFHAKSLIEWLRQYEERAKLEMVPAKLQSSNRAKIFRVKITPAGVYLYGPTLETKNRVLRQYSSYLDHFLRVEFCDEDGQQVRYDPRVSSDNIFYGRFQRLLQDGITVVGRVYGFLGYSHSSLRAQTCWFMAPFWSDGELKFYQKLIADLGDFSRIHCPAKCAARIGQTFSDTPTTVPLKNATVINKPDVERNKRVFSDGVGTFSESVLEQIIDALPSKNLVKPTVFQIRHQGAKGMISLDSRIKENSLFLRPSMIKFEGSLSTDIEICGAAWRPLPMYLNRQLIKIMEDLGVKDEFFLNLQEEAVHCIVESTKTESHAADFLSAHGAGGIVGLPKFIRQLAAMNLSFKEDHFLNSLVKTTAMVELRSLKHRSRILVEDGYTLYGIMDETATLKEGQVFVTYDTNLSQRRVLVQDKIIVTRSPALHPGDVRVVNAVDVPLDSPLQKLANVIVFSQMGERDLPSMLSGGDLDGDLYNIIFDRNLSIKHVHEPADYPRQEPLDIGRTVTREDITDFLVTFMATDQLGRIATIHMLKADQQENGTFDSDCIALAELHSIAVDYSKTGIPVDVHEIPKYSRFRPDFMAPGPHVTITKKGDVDFTKTENEDIGEDEEDFQSYSYYESNKVLGKLYRAIDEEEIFRVVEQTSLPHRGVSVAHSSTIIRQQNVMDVVLTYVTDQCRSLRWDYLLEEARNIREEYEECLEKIMFEFSDKNRPVSETEVFVGNILGKTGAQTRRQRDSSNSMKELFEEDVSYIMNKITRDGAQPSIEALERAVACFEISYEVGRVRNTGHELVSFKYVAASLCLRELQRCRGGRLSF